MTTSATAAEAAETGASRVAPRRRFDRWQMIAIAFAVPWLVVAVVRTIAPVPHVGYDLELLGHAATRLIDGLPVYGDLSGAQFYPGSLDLYYGPPAYLLPWLPLAHMPDLVLQRLAYPMGIAEVALAVALLVWDQRKVLSSSHMAAIAIGALGCWVVFAGVSLGASSNLTLVFVALTWFFLNRGADARAGIALGTIVAWRVYPAGLILPLLIARRWRAAAFAAVVAAAWTIVGSLVVGKQSWEYPALLLRLGNLHIPGTASPAAYVDYLGAGDPAVIAVLGAATMVSGAIMVWAGVQLRSRLPGWPLVGWGLAAAGCLLLPGVIWDHDLTLLLVLAVGLVVASGSALPGLLPLGIWSAVAGGGLALLWMPAVTLLIARRQRLRTVQPLDPDLTSNG
jgi:arabinofuranan 3-O-arabinosyltransferase